jgi:hypothetical protein
VGTQAVLESNENENRIHQNLWGTAKAVLRGQFTAVSTYTEIEKRTKLKPGDLK